MKLISKEEFLKYKKSDTLVIWGSGSSNNSLTDDDFKELNKYDSICINNFVKTGIKTTFCIIGEILLFMKREE